MFIENFCWSFEENISLDNHCNSWRMPDEIGNFSGNSDEFQMDFGAVIVPFENFKNFDGFLFLLQESIRNLLRFIYKYNLLFIHSQVTIKQKKTCLLLIIFVCGWINSYGSWYKYYLQMNTHKVLANSWC